MFARASLWPEYQPFPSGDEPEVETEFTEG